MKFSSTIHNNQSYQMIRNKALIFKPRLQSNLRVDFFRNKFIIKFCTVNIMYIKKFKIVN